MAEPLHPHDPQLIRTLLAADGYCKLKMWEDAWNELETLGPNGYHLDAAMMLRMEIHSGLRQFEEAARLADKLIAKGTKDGSVYLMGAYAIRRSRSLGEAERFLQSGEELLSKHAIFHFNLACYACVAGRLEEAKEKLGRAFKLDASYRNIAREDEDLKPLWGKI